MSLIPNYILYGGCYITLGEDFFGWHDSFNLSLYPENTIRVPGHIEQETTAIYTANAIRARFEAILGSNPSVKDSIRMWNLLCRGCGVWINLGSPGDLEVKDPDNLTISKELNEIPWAEYIETDIDGDGDPEDMIAILSQKMGNYSINVIPEPDASPNDTYSLEVERDYILTTLAEDVQISDIPDEPYTFESEHEDWLVTATEIYSNQEIALNGKLLVIDGGNLTLDNVTLKINCSSWECNIEVIDGALYINNSNITRVEPDIKLTVLPGSKLEMKNSELCGVQVHIQANNTIIKNNSIVGGVSIHECSNTQIINNNISGSSRVGIHLYSSSNYNALTNNIVSNKEYGIWLSSSSNNDLTRNNAYNNYYGIYLDSSSNNDLTSNNAYNNNHGIELYHSSNNNLTSNNAYNNNYGITLYHSSNNNDLTSNNAYNNYYDGICLSSSSNNDLTSNNAYNNSDRGIWLSSSSNNMLMNNIASNNGDGIYLRYSSNNNLTSNTANSNDCGIYLYSSSNNNNRVVAI
ncbi:MAG: NosD domain-containing protein [Halobacteriota archaeon]